MWRRVGLVRTDVSDECAAFIFTVERIREIGTILAVTISLLLTEVLSDKYLGNVISKKTHTPPHP
jgi:hypothetical protein